MKCFLEISTDGNGIAEYTFPTAVKTASHIIFH